MQLLTVEEAAQALKVGRTRMFALLREGRIASVRIGTSRRVPEPAIAAYVDELMSEAAGD
jgi:excisionase family DNA binding protein